MLIEKSKVGGFSIPKDVTFPLQPHHSQFSSTSVCKHLTLYLTSEESSLFTEWWADLANFLLSEMCWDKFSWSDGILTRLKSTLKVAAFIITILSSWILLLQGRKLSPNSW